MPKQPKPHLSIIIPHYNDGNKIGKLFESLYHQSLKKFEIIVIDDMSTKNKCDRLCDTYSKKGLNIRLINAKKKLYTKNARLHAINFTNSNAIIFADCDDVFYNNDTLGNLIEEFFANNTDILHFIEHRIYKDGSYNHEHRGPFGRKLIKSKIFHEFVNTKQHTIWGKVYSKKLMNSVYKYAFDIPIKHYAEDVCLTPFIMAIAKKYIGSDIIGYTYGVKQNKNIEEYVERALAYYTIYEYVPKKLLALNVDPYRVFDWEMEIVRQIVLYMGRILLSFDTYDSIIRGDALEKFLAKYADLKIWLKIFALSNASNAMRLQNIAHDLYLNFIQPHYCPVKK